MTEVDDIDLAVASMIPEEIFRHLGPVELGVRIAAGRRILAKAELEGTDKTRARHELKRLMESISLKTFLALAGAGVRVSEASAQDVRNELARDTYDLIKRNPAIEMIYGLPEQTQLAIFREQADNSTGEATKPRDRKLKRKTK